MLRSKPKSRYVLCDHYRIIDRLPRDPSIARLRFVIQDLKPLIAARLRAARKAKGLSQASVAEAVSRTEEAISNIERGLALPRLDLLQKLSGLLDVPLDELVRVPAGDGPVAERATLELAILAHVAALPIERLRIAAKQIEALLENSR